MIRAFFGLVVMGVMLVHPAHAIKKPDLSGFRIAGGGTSVSVGPNQSGIAGSLAPVRTGGGPTGTIPPGHVGSQIGNSGWYVGTAPVGSATGTTAHLGHAGDVFFAGTKYPFQAGYKVEPSALVSALGMLCKTPVTCAAAVAGSALQAWLSDLGVGINTNEADYPEKPFTLKREGPIEGLEFSAGGAWFPTPNQAAQDWARRANAIDSTWTYTISSADNEGYFYTCTDKQQGHACNGGQPLRGGLNNRPTTTTTGVDIYPASMDDIAPYMTPRPFSPGVVSELLDKGADIALPEKPTLSGPTQIKGPVTTIQNADGTTTTKQTVSNFQISGNTITNTSNVTITNTCTAEGSCSTSTETTKPDPNADPDEQQDDSAADSPMPTIPKLYERQYPDGMVGIWNQKQQQLKDTSVGQLVTQLMPNVGDGGCPKWQIPLDVGIADYGVFDASIPCQYWAVIRIVLIVGSLFLARAIIFGG